LETPNPTNMQKVLVLGAGSWGATLAHLLAEKGHNVRLWSRHTENADRLGRERTLPGKLSDFHINGEVTIGSDLESLCEGANLILFAVPSKHLREIAHQAQEVAQKHLSEKPIVVTASKGLEVGSLKRMSEILAEEFNSGSPVALSGPSHAEEVCAGLPTTVVAASENLEAAEQVQQLFMTPRFRVYTSQDTLGVELGGALKNVMAIATGAATAMGLGDNTLAGLVTRGLAEISRLGVAMGAQPLTFAGLSGLGDLVVTCTSDHSRNRRLGMELAGGATLEEAVQRIGMVVEGVETARSVEALKGRYGVEMPISTQVARVLFDGMPVADAVQSLMLRDPKPE